MKRQIRSIIKSSKVSITLIVVAAVLSQIFSLAQYFYTRNAVRKHTAEQTAYNLTHLQRIVNLKSNVETAVQNAMGDVQINLQDPDKFYGIVTRLVMRNPHIVGSAVAMKPNFYPQKDSLYAPFAYPESLNSKEQPRTKLLPYNYTLSDWYIKPFEADSAIWSQPYQDVGGSELLIHTYGQPIHNSQGQVVGVLTADVYFKELAEKDENAYDDVDKVNLVGFVFQLLGLLLIIWIVWRYSTKLRQANWLQNEQEVIGKDLQIASDIQKAMLPNITTEENKRYHIDIRESLVSAPNVSADFYDYFYVGKKLVFCIGDVPGSNVKAALMMSVTRSAFRTAATMESKLTKELSPAAIVKTMNQAICTINHNQMFSTLLVGVLDLDTAQLTCCNAGNPAPVMLSPTIGAKLLEVEPNIPLGIDDNYDYSEQKITLEEHFTLFLYNDGVYETENSLHEPYGQKRMLTRLQKFGLAQESPEKILTKMQEVLAEHRGNAPQADDILMLALKFMDV